MTDIKMTHQYPRVLTIAGSDSGGGAGIQADLKTMSALGCFGMSAITALTAQNTTGVRAIHAVPPEMLTDQIDAVVEDIGVDAVKIGMLHAPDIVQAVANAIDKHQLRRVVLDPVMVATSGAVLIDNPAIQALVQLLFPRVDIITPNLDEAGLLVGRTLHNEHDMQQAASNCWTWERLPCCSKAVTCKATPSVTCSSPARGRHSGCGPPASTATTRTAQVAPCRPPWLRTWLWVTACLKRLHKLTATSDRRCNPVLRYAPATAAARSITSAHRCPCTCAP